MSPPPVLVCHVPDTGVQGEVYEEDEENDEEYNDENYNQDDPGVEFVVKADIVTTHPLALNNNSRQWSVETKAFLPHSWTLSDRSWRRDTTHTLRILQPGRPCRT